MNESSSIVSRFEGALRQVLHEDDFPVTTREKPGTSSIGDLTSKYQVFSCRGSEVAFILCSPPNAPDIARRGAERAREAAKALGPILSRRVVAPIYTGDEDGVSYAIYQPCKALSESKLVWSAQRRMLAPILVEWLFCSTELTLHEVPDEAIKPQFVDPLDRMARVVGLSNALCKSAKQAVERLEGGNWSPGYVLMHGDLWRGNLMLGAKKTGAQERWVDRVVVIDWPGARVDGYAIYDLVRVAQSLGFSKSQLRAELVRHCRLLQCDLGTSVCYLIAALAYIHDNMGYFPHSSFVSLAENCLVTLNEALT